MSVKQSPVAANDAQAEISPLSKELVIGLVGYAGAGCSTAAKRLHAFLSDLDYDVHRVKLSALISAQNPKVILPATEEGRGAGKSKLARAVALQDMGDAIRKSYGTNAVASLAVRKILDIRGVSAPGSKKIAFILESLKHHDEVNLLRQVYDVSFRLVAVHCDRDSREKRLIGKSTSNAKYAGVSADEVKSFMDRDEKDSTSDHGQEVRDAFYLADYFLDNSSHASDGANLNEDLERFVALILGEGLVRPTTSERAMYHAQAAAHQSSCLSRQVGAALTSSSGEILSTGTNDVPKFGGGIYSEDSKPDHRCHVWQWKDGDLTFVGCHNDRKKKTLRAELGAWMAANVAAELAELSHPIQAGNDTAAASRRAAEIAIRNYLSSAPAVFDRMPGIKDIIEYSRAIHAEMDAVLSAARVGVSPVGSTLYCTTYPCHNCARHLVTAGVRRVYFIEPYVKSLANELHSDAITGEADALDRAAEQTRMAIQPFTGVGPRMYDDLFVKRGVLKKAGGAYDPPKAGVPAFAVRLKELAGVEQIAAKLVPTISDT